MAIRVEHREATETWPALELRISTRRRRSATATFEGSHLVIALPARMSLREREETIAWLVERSLARRAKLPSSDEGLARLAAEVGDSYLDGLRPASVVWSDRQQKRFGSCSTDSGAIRISSRLREAPRFVLECVLVHEMAHLRHPDHSSAFHELANRHPKQREATTWLEGFEAGYQQGAGS